MRPLALLLPALLLALPASAQDAILMGKVFDSVTKEPLEGVVVRATSANLQGEQVVVTDASGAYGFPGLPPGIYFLNFEKEGFQTYGRAGIRLRVGLTFRTDMRLDSEELGGCRFAEVYPALDVSSSSTGMRFGQDFILDVPLPRP